MFVPVEPRRLIYAAFIGLAVYAGIALRYAALGEGFASDDYMHYAMLEGVYPTQRAQYDLFNFYRSTEEIKALKNFGTLPWWSDPNFRLAMLRPLSSALIVFDYVAFGDDLVAFHLHSVLWWAFFVICVALLLDEALPMPMSFLAVVLFALDESHGLPFTWLANRNALVSLGLGVLGLRAHVIRRRAGGQNAPVLSVILFCLALLGGEWVFPVMAYLAAFELFSAPGPWKTRIKALMPAVLLGFGFIGAQALLGYGALNSSVYVSPWSAPVLFLQKALQRIPIFFAEMVFGVPTFWWHTDSPWRSFFLSLDIFSPSVWRFFPAWKVWHVGIGVAAIATIVPLVIWGWREQDSKVRVELRWLLGGALFSLIPMIASLPTERLTLPAEIGFAAVFSMLIIQGAKQLYRSVERKLLLPALAALIVVSGGLWFHVWSAAVRSRSDVQTHRYLHDLVAVVVDQAEIDDSRVARQRIVLVNPMEHSISVFLPFIRYFLRHPLPVSCWALSAASHAHDIARTAPNVIEMSVLGGTLMGNGVENFYRDDRFPFRKGETVVMDGLKTEVLRVVNGNPFLVRFTFDKPVDDPSYVFLHSTFLGLQKLEMPKVGEVIRLPRPPFPDPTLFSRSTIRVREPVNIQKWWSSRLSRYLRIPWLSRP